MKLGIHTNAHTLFPRHTYTYAYTHYTHTNTCTRTLIHTHMHTPVDSTVWGIKAPLQKISTHAREEQ